MIKLLLKILAITLLITFIHLTNFSLDQQIEIKINHVIINLNLLFVELSIVIMLMLVIKFANIISSLLNIPYIIKSKINNIKIANQLLFLKDGLIYYHFELFDEAKNEFNKLLDQEVKLLLYKIIDKEFIDPRINEYKKAKLLNYPQIIENLLQLQDMETVEQLVKVRAFPKLEIIFRQIIQRYQAVGDISNNNYNKALKLLTHNLKTGPHKQDFTLYVSSLYSLHKNSKLPAVIDEFWPHAPNYQVFNLIIKNFAADLSYEDQIKQINDIFHNQKNDFYWQYYLCLYLINQGQHRLLDKEFINITPHNIDQKKLLLNLQIFYYLEISNIQQAKAICNKIIDQDIN